jgi:hypothetical protein
MRHNYGDLDDLDLDDDDDDLVRDGEVTRVPVMLMDGLDETQRAIRDHFASGGAIEPLHRPGFAVTTDSDDAVAAHREYTKFLVDAHGRPDAQKTKAAPARPSFSLDAARAEADRAYAERSRWLENAHKERR